MMAAERAGAAPRGKGAEAPGALPGAAPEKKPAGPGPIPACASGVPIFQVLPEPALARLAAGMVHRQYAKGSLVISSGEPVNRLMVVAQGRLNLLHSTAAGRVQVVRVLQPGDFLGEMALFAPVAAEGDLVAAEESTLCLLPREEVQALVEDHPEMASVLVTVLAGRLQAAEQLIADLGMKEVGQRLASELLRMAATGDDGEGSLSPAGDVDGPGRAGGLDPRGAPSPSVTPGTKISVSVPWTEVAARLGTTPESLSRRLKQLSRRGYIRQEGPRTVVILSPSDLESLAAGEQQL